MVSVVRCGAVATPGGILGEGFSFAGEQVAVVRFRWNVTLGGFPRQRQRWQRQADSERVGMLQPSSPLPE